MHLVNTSASLLALAWSAHAQTIFINQVPEYSALPACAEAPLSQIVRGMISGCGDGGRTTSYNCFCVESSTRFVNAIGTAVASKCPTDPAAAQSALEVFDDYCHLAQGAAPTQGVNGSNAPTSNVTPARATPETTVGRSTDRTVPEVTTQAAYTPVRTHTGPILTSGATEIGYLGPGYWVALGVALVYPAWG